MSYQPYADHHITARARPLIEAAPVDRSGKYGWWYHPGLPDFEEGDKAPFRDWLREQQLELVAGGAGLLGKQRPRSVVMESKATRG